MILLYHKKWPAIVHRWQKQSWPLSDFLLILIEYKDFLMTDTFNPLDVLREEMESEEISFRVNAVHRMRVVASLIPGDKIKS